MSKGIGAEVNDMFDDIRGTCEDCEHPRCLAKIKSAKRQILSFAQAKDNAYWERNQLVAALSKMYPAWLGWHKDKDWEDDWCTIVYIKIPIVKPMYYGDQRNNYPKETVTEWQQLSWRIHDNDKKYFTHLDPGIEEWDGHTTEEKYERLKVLQNRKAE